jgi:L-amino acid N-acyltransferase YncA
MSGEMAVGVAVRMAGADDAAALAAIYRPYVTDAVTSFEIDPPGAAEMARRIEAVLGVAPWLVALDDTGDPIGYAYASRHAERAAYQWSVDVTVYIRQGNQRRGVGRALYAALFPLLRLQGFYVAHAGITLPNPASVGLHESFGFLPVGVYPAVGWKLGAWRDVGWWQLPLQPRPAVPAPPLSLADAQKLPSWPTALRTNR